jgi:hypothetical protein
MTSKPLAALIVAAVTSGPASGVAAAAKQETGFHTMHALSRVGGKLCMAGHTHAGQSLPSGTGSKSVALRTAVNNWERFTAEEYGSAWGSWSKAWAKRESCSGGDGRWMCEVTARPCR